MATKERAIMAYYDDSFDDYHDDPFDNDYDSVDYRVHNGLPSGNSDSEWWKGCLTVIGVIAALWFVNYAFKQCQCAFLRLFQEEPPYYTTDDDRYHRDHCPYMTEDNYVGDEFDSRAEAEYAGYEPCPHCLE